MTTRIAVIALALAVGGCAGVSDRKSDDTESAAEINTRLGLGYLQQGNTEQALDKLKKALQQDPRLAKAHHYIAETYRQTGQMPDAEAHFKQALKLAPRDAAIQNNFGVFLCDQKEFEDADRLFLRAARTRDYAAAAEAYENAGLCALRQPDLQRAEERFREALRLSAKRPRSLLQMTELSVAQREFLEARAFLQRYAEVAAHTPRSLWLGVRIERELGDWQAAQSYGKLLESNFPDAEETDMYQKLSRNEQQS